ncbi:MAG: hypothetical protein ACSNEK_09675 [Parachlamydiaceae bacterium]
MKARGYDDKVRNFQNSLYQNLKRHHEIGRFAALPIAVMDVTAMIGGISLELISNLALVPINVVGSCCNKKYSFKDARTCLTQAAKILPVGLVLVGISPVLIACQTLNILTHPRSVKPTIDSVQGALTALAVAITGGSVYG